MDVRFRRTGLRRYAVVVTLPGNRPHAMDPAPGYDENIPHDLVHYVVEAELGLTNAVYGRAAQGAGTFIAIGEVGASSKERARRQRKQQKRERALGARDALHASDMARSERLAALCDVTWRRKHGQHPDPSREAPVRRPEDTADVERIVSRLDAIAPLWRRLEVGGELVFEWPQVMPTHTSERNTGQG